jgi:hypothetical protein
MPIAGLADVAEHTAQKVIQNFPLAQGICS